MNVRVTPTFFNSSVADLRDGLQNMPDRSINLICSDLPYQGKYVEVYRSLSYLSGRALVENGVLAVMTGTIHLPVFLSALCECTALSYIGTIAVIADSAGGQYRGISTHWKPVIVMAKGKYTGELISDVIHAPPDPNGEDRKYHRHGQSEAVISKLIDMFSDPLDFVADFCCGGGTTAVCALRLGRRTFASDISKESVKITQRRVAALLEAKKAEYELEDELFKGKSPIYRDKHRKDNDQ